MARDPNEKVPLTLRIPERQRAYLERIAKKTKVSLNTEIVRRIERTIEEDTLITGEHNKLLLRIIGAAIALVEKQTEKTWIHDQETINRVRHALRATLNIIWGDDYEPPQGKIRGYEAAMQAVDRILEAIEPADKVS